MRCRNGKRTFLTQTCVVLAKCDRTESTRELYSARKGKDVPDQVDLNRNRDSKRLEKLFTRKANHSCRQASIN